VYVDARLDGVQSRRVSQHVNGICLAYGITPPERQERVVAYITDLTRVKLTPTGMGMGQQGPDVPASDEARDVVLAQPFFAHHVHRGLWQAGRIDLVLANIRTRWGAMIAAGSATIWELWHPMASQCHAWSTTPTFDLSTYVLGVTSLADGFARVLIAPQPADLAWARGRLPTPHGPIEVAWQQTEEVFQLAVTVPEAAAFRIVLPFAAARIEINDQLAWEKGKVSQAIAGLSPIERGTGQVELVCERGGSYSIQASRASKMAVSS
jgi:hypothetical protein